MRLFCISWKSLVAGCALATLPLIGYAVDAVAIDASAGERAQQVRVGVQWNWEKRWFQSNGSHIGGYWDLSLAQWRGTQYQGVSGQHQSLTSIGITPVFRWQNDSKKGDYAEAGIGAHYLSKLYNNSSNQLSTRYQFGSLLGIGHVFDNKLDLGLRVQHFSNGGIKSPNSGVNFIGLHASYPL